MDEIFKKRYPPSAGCSCDVCINYCRRPGWWTVGQARRAIEKGYASRMMLEISPDFKFAVLSPAFYGCEGFIATNDGAKNGCNFLKEGMCELHDTDILPLECAFCHHERVGKGIVCHNEISTQWHTLEAQKLVARWQKIVNFEEKLEKISNKV